MTSIQPTQEFPKAYDHRPVEERLYHFWMEQGYFTPTIQPGKKPFVIIMPPPNVTGELHLGHAIVVALEDAMTRWHRMRGEPTLWLPGTDHAGIATQVVVERILAQEGLTRQQLGREKFVERVWEWVRKYGSIIDEQHKRLGASCDWTRKRFTLDAGPSLAVRTTFVNLYNKGLIYRGERITNWCPRCATALSDLEVDHSEEQGSLYYIRYPFEGGGGHLTVATTRPETLLGDTAVAVNPDDPRYRSVIGKLVMLPVLGRRIPVIADEAVDSSFGTGALKVTPGHDATDFDIGQRHGLPVINVMNLDATLNENAGHYKGWERTDARKAIVEQLEREALLEKVEPYALALSRCNRCNTVVEPLVSKQWFIRMKPLAQPAIQAVEDGTIRIVPQRFTAVYMNWMENIRDWCISRQLWWGHRIPVWYCEQCACLTVQVQDVTRCAHCGSSSIQQDPDVLDTWFSSGLWPHSTLGWPQDTEDHRYFYPTSVMETAYDILFFWVARMIMLGIENTGQVPFHTVYLHGLIRDAHGVKMSKSRGNVIDPLKSIESHGADALRFAITTGTTPGIDSRLSPEKLEAARNFANKLWNATRYVTTTLEGADNLDGWSSLTASHREDRWILSRHHRLTQRVNQLLADFQFAEAERELYDFLWGEFCDWYIEMAKVRLRQGDTAPLPVLAYVLERTLRLLHPFMPFITEELWQRLTQVLPKEGGLPDSIMVAPYPEASEQLLDTATEDEVDLVRDIVQAIRNIRAEFKIEPRQPLEAIVAAPEMAAVVAGEAEAIRSLARVEPLRILEHGVPSPSSHQTVTLVVGKATIYLPLGDAVDLASERQRLQNELASTKAATGRLEQRLADQQFLSKAPEEVVEKERERLASAQERLTRIGELLGQLGG
ncbi:MAG: valine--tRNA ligase [Dehalococcoidia bacterium]|nr:valine--tRNA ligase [Dehalococcoidia bacterium]